MNGSNPHRQASLYCSTGLPPLSTKPAPGFSLIEIVLALGIISFALVGIMGLFPVAMRSAQESQRETRAAQIAMQIFNDLKSAPATNTFIAKSTNFTSPQVSVNLSQSSSNWISYSINGTPLSDGTSAPDRAFLAEILVTTNTPMSNLARVQVTIEAPAMAADRTNRSKYSFVTLMNQQ